MTARAPRGGADDGFTLVELVIYSSLLVLVLLVTGSLLVSTLRLEKQVASGAAATGSAEAATGSVLRNLANSSGVLAVATPTGEALLARVANVAPTGTTTWSCQAWYYAADTHTLSWTRNLLAAVPVPALPGTPTGWTVLATGVGLPAGASRAFAVSGGQVAVALTVASAPAVVVRTTVTPDPQSDLTTAPRTCF